MNLDTQKKLGMLGIRIRNSATENEKTTCPKCSHTRKKKTDPCLSVTVKGDEAVWNCFNCQWKGTTAQGRKDAISPPKKFAKPNYKEPEKPLSENVIEFFKSRGISEKTLNRNRITSGIGFMAAAKEKIEAIKFPFLKNGEVVNVKYRSLVGKHFQQVKDAEKVFYGLDDVAAFKTAIICEGEIDKLSLEEAGFKNVISVPDGAPAKVKENASPDDKKFEYIGNSWENLKHIKNFVLAVDNDEPGKVLEEELARRIGREKCSRVIWPDSDDSPCKDANDVLLSHGAQVLKECIELATPFPLKNIVKVNEDLLLKLYHEGQQRALSTGWNCLDEFLKIREGELSVVTGIPGSGKSEFIDALMMNLAENHDWNFAICSFENSIEEHFIKFAEKRLRLPFYKGPSMRMTEDQLKKEAAPWIDSHFHFMGFGEDSPDIDAILDSARGTVLRHGIRGLVIDPYNEIEHKRVPGQTETEYVSKMLGKVKRFAQNHGVHVWFVAHPAKMMRGADGKMPIPNLYDISGSANWVNKADVGVVVHRDPKNNDFQTEVHIKKIRFRIVGKPGFAVLNWDKKTGRYSDPNENYPSYIPPDTAPLSREEDFLS